MATRQMTRSLTRALALAFNEWLLMLMLFFNSIFTYVITRFADYSKLQSPCLMCSRLDHILGKEKQSKNKKTHWDMICSKHKSEISSLVYCHAHGKLVDVRGMCETCLFSFATTNKSNAETYRLLVGKLGEDSSCSGSKIVDRSTNPRYCTCCNQLWMPQTASSAATTTQVVKPGMLPKIRLVSDVMRTGKQESTTPKKSVRFNDLPHVGYTELKFHSDTESEALVSEDEGVVKEEYHKFRTVDLETSSPLISLPYDLATDKLLNLDFPLQEINLRTDSLFPELIQVNGVPETSEKAAKEEKIISLDNLFLTSRTMEPSLAVLEETKELIRLGDDVSLTPDCKENPADALMEETELVSVSEAPETSEKVLKEEEIISLDNLFLTSRAMEPSAVVLKETEDLIQLQDDSLTPDFEENPVNASLKEETELICPNDGTSTSVSAADLLMKETEDLVKPQDDSLTPDFEVSPENALKEETELICLSDVTSTSSSSAETPEDALMEETVSKETEDLIHLQDTSSTPDLKESPANALMEETELICFNDVTSTSDAAETPENVLKGIDLMSLNGISLDKVPEPFTPNETSVETLKEPETELICLIDVVSTSDASETPEELLREIEFKSLHDISLDKVLESFTTNDTSVETSKERHTDQADISSLESEDVVVSSSKSIPENSTKNCVSENKEMNETSPKVSSVSEMAPPAEAAQESESSSFNSMSVAAETNQYSGELLDLADAYNIIVSNEGNKDSSSRGEEIEQWIKKDTSRVSEDLKALLTQISASRGIEFLSPRDISPKICSDQEAKNLDLDMQLLLQKRMLERNESNLSLEGVSVIEIEGESESDRLKRQVDHDRKLLAGLYKELEEERSASAIATNQAMAMITRLQEEKALFQMEALQNLRMMEEQAEYDMEAIQRLNDLLVEREKMIQDLEAEIEYFRDQTPQKKNNLDVAERLTERTTNKIQNYLTGFDEERLYITNCLEEIENRVNGEAHVDIVANQESVSELHERVERLKGDLYFLEHVVSSLGHGNEGVQFVKEIASHLQTLRSLSMKRQDHTEN